MLPESKTVCAEIATSFKALFVFVPTEEASVTEPAFAVTESELSAALSRPSLKTASPNVMSPVVEINDEEPETVLSLLSEPHTFTYPLYDWSPLVFTETP